MHTHATNRRASFPTLRLAIAIFSIGLPCISHAENIVYATSSQFLLTDSGNSAVTAQQLNYVPESGYSVNGIDYNSKDLLLYVFSRNSSSNKCLVNRFAPDTMANGATVTFGASNRVGNIFDCAGIADYEANKIGQIGFAIGGNKVLDGTTADGTVVSRTVSNASGTGSLDMRGLARDNRNIDSNNADALLAVDLTSKSLVRLTGNPDGSGTATVVGALGIPVGNGASPLDWSPNGTVYLLTAGKLYSVNTTSGAANLIGTAPSNVEEMTVSLKWASSASGSSGGSSGGGTSGSGGAGTTTGTSSVSSSGGGALGWMSLLPLLLVGARKRSKCW